VVGDDDRRTVDRDALDAGDVEAGVREELGTEERPQEAGGLEAHQLGHSRGQVEVPYGPPAEERGDAEARVRVDGVRMADGREEREVEDAVGVGPALTQVDAAVLGPLTHGGELPGAPYEPAVELAGVLPVRLGVPGGDDVVEVEAFGERLDQVVGGRRRQHHRAAGAAVFVHQWRGERRHGIDERVRRGLGRLLYRLAHPAAGEVGGAAGEEHARQRLPDDVVEPVEEAHPRDLAIAHDPRGDQRLGDDRPAGAAEQRPVEIEERRTT
jgi:hypothetical protein